MGKGALRKRGHHIPENCCPSDYLSPITPVTSRIWEWGLFSFHRGCSESPQHRESPWSSWGLLGLSQAPFRDWHYLEERYIFCSSRTRKTNNSCLNKSEWSVVSLPGESPSKDLCPPSLSRLPRPPWEGSKWSPLEFWEAQDAENICKRVGRLY